jgi:hypothetical protein
MGDEQGSREVAGFGQALHDATNLVRRMLRRNCGSKMGSGMLSPKNCDGDIAIHLVPQL